MLCFQIYLISKINKLFKSKQIHFHNNYAMVAFIINSFTFFFIPNKIGYTGCGSYLKFDIGVDLQN